MKIRRLIAALVILPLILMAGYYSGSETVSTAGTRVQLSNASPAPPTNCISITVQWKSSNAGTIYIGSSNVSAANKIGLALNSTTGATAYYAPSSTTALYSTAAIYIDATNSGDGITYTCYK